MASARESFAAGTNKDHNLAARLAEQLTRVEDVRARQSRAAVRTDRASWRALPEASRS